MKILLAYYHPVIYDLAETLLKLGSVESVDICVVKDLSDNYGGPTNVFKKVKENKHLDKTKVFYDSVAHQLIKAGAYDIVGVDGVFSGDDLIMELCQENKIPYFCINGYPHQLDEPSHNIMAFSWHLPQVQYKQANPHEGYVKERDWKDISQNGRSQGKNVFVFYPEMNEAKRFHSKSRTRTLESATSPYFLSLIHRYAECNRWNHEVFNLIGKLYKVENFSTLTQEQSFKKILLSDGLLHLKHGDCPGISVLEALILGKPVITMESFVKASFNQEVLIDEYNSIICQSVGEMAERMRDIRPINPRATEYIWDLTSFSRQRRGLLRFLRGCRESV